MVRVRFAPSPTGYLHIGGVRTALFNFLYTRSQQGEFLLRIEDTDRERSKPEFETEILKSLEWLGLNWDNRLMRQSERLSKYREFAQLLVKQGKAYEDTQEGKTAIKFKMPSVRASFRDLVHGQVEFETALFGDLVILKSDGYPTYHWACVIDDHEMEITHVIRGDDHLSNTPRQIMLFEALGWIPPEYGHLPLIAGEDGTPLSKRHGAVSLTHFREQGYLPSAILNYLALLGWNPGSQDEYFSLNDLIQKFSLKQINKSNAKFSLEKLGWLNAEHLKAVSADDFLKLISDFYPDLKQKKSADDWAALVQLYRPRIQILKDFREKSLCFFEEPHLDPEAIKKYFHETPNLPKYLRVWTDEIGKVEPFTTAVTEKLTREVAERSGVKAGVLIHPIRYALTGTTMSPGLFELIVLLGRETCLKRMSVFLNS